MPVITEQEQVGEQLRRLRAEQGLSVRTLASQAGFSPSFISQVENGQVSPSISSLERIAAVLGVTLAGFFGRWGNLTGTVMRSNQRQEMSSSWSRARIESLGLAPGESSLDAVMITIEPGGRSGTQASSHAGEEFAFAYQGEVILTLGSESLVLSQGDAASFSSERPHLWENSGREAAQIVIVSPRFTH